MELDVWNDATATATLAAEVSAPRDYARQFILPGDCLRVRGLIEQRPMDTARPAADDQCAGAARRVVHAKPCRLAIRQPIGRWRRHSDERPARRRRRAAMAWTNARRITGSDTAMQAMHQLYRQALVDAAAVDGAEARRKRSKSDRGSISSPLNRGCSQWRALTSCATRSQRGRLALLAARVGLTARENGCYLLENMFVRKEGGLSKRPGTRFIASTKVHAGDRV
ncbi:MAG: hypothetical protein IPK75_20580 [Acidobacteria bacterium]|nr:hypothetical protein [Acidobacteriota bacterium]